MTISLEIKTSMERRLWGWGDDAVGRELASRAAQLEWEMRTGNHAARSASLSGKSSTFLAGIMGSHGMSP